MKKSITLLVLIAFPLFVNAQVEDEKAISELVNTFLEKVDSKEMHDRFWAEDLIYTSSSGKRHGKKTIMSGFSNEAEDSSANGPTYTAEEMNVRVFNDMAVVTFKLVSMNEKKERMEYLNSGTFIKRNNEWEVINWQATKAAVN